MSKQSDLVSVSQGASGDPLFIDTVNDRVGIGTSSPTARLTTADGFMSFVSADANGYARFTATNASAQLGLFRSGSSAGGGYLGANSDASFIAYDGSFTERMRIDAAGRVTMPYQPAFYARRTAGSVTGPATVVFNDAQLNVGGHYNAGTGTFTVPIAGVYEFHVSLLTNGGATRCQSDIQVNGLGRTILEQSAGYGYQQGSMTLMLSLAANDFVTVTMNSSSDAMYGFGYNSFSGKLVG